MSEKFIKDCDDFKKKVDTFTKQVEKLKDKLTKTTADLNDHAFKIAKIKEELSQYKSTSDSEDNKPSKKNINFFDDAYDTDTEKESNI